MGKTNPSNAETQFNSKHKAVIRSLAKRNFNDHRLALHYELAVNWSDYYRSQSACDLKLQDLAKRFLSWPVTTETENCGDQPSIPAILVEYKRLCALQKDDTFNNVSVGIVDANWEMARKALLGFSSEIKQYEEKYTSRFLEHVQQTNPNGFERLIEEAHDHAKPCHYCGTTLGKITELARSGRLTSKRMVTRGLSLEIDQLNPEGGYHDLGNLVLACYWCNNAKTDSFSSTDFKETIGKAMGDLFRKIDGLKNQPGDRS